MADFHRAGAALDLDGSAIGSVFHGFHTGNGSCLKVAKHGRPVVRWPITQTQGDAGIGVRRTTGTLMSQRARRAVEKLVKDLIEAAQTAEASCQGNVGHRHSGFMNELFREEHAACLGNGDGRSSQMLPKETSKLSFAYSETF